jgi:tetratricopeptide (TPR) repeat protein
VGTWREFRFSKELEMRKPKKRRVKQNLLLKTLPPLLAILLQSVTAFPQSRGLEQQFQKAQELETQGRLDEAAKTYQEILKSDPKNLPVLSALGVVLARQKRYAEAVRYYRQALAIKPQNFSTQLNLGLSYFKMGEFRSAIAPLKTALALEPSNAQAATLLGMAYFGAGDYRHAVEPLRSVASADPTNSTL